MNVYLNNECVDTPEGTTLAQLLSERALDAPGTAVAVDGKVITRQAREEFVLQPNSKIIVIKAACGG